MLAYRKLKGYKYQVAELFHAAVPELLGVTLDEKWFAIRGGELMVYSGYAWDGASGPTIDTEATMEAALVHDVLYQCIRANRLPKESRAIADAILYRLLRQGQQKWAEGHSTALGRTLASVWVETRAMYYFAAVRAFGALAVKPKDLEAQDIIYTL